MLLVRAHLTDSEGRKLTDMPIENPGPGEVQVRIEAVRMCGSDRHAFTEGAVGSTLDLL
jgi:threonine dehydrogenase-like Zn-dependent dehydrogenase